MISRLKVVQSREHQVIWSVFELRAAVDEPVLQSLGPAELGQVSATAGGELRYR